MKGNFWRKHGRFLLRAFAALIVFVSFIVKDERRDDLKSLVDSIDAAENAFIMRTQNAALRDQMRTSNRQLGQLAAEFNDFRKHPHAISDSGVGSGGGWGFSQKQFEADLNEAADARLALDNIVRLVERIPHSDSLSGQLQLVRTSISDFQNLSTEVAGLAKEKELAYKEHRNGDTWQLDRKLDQKSDKLDELARRISESWRQLETQVLPEADQQREQAGEKFRFWNRINYVVIFCAAVLAFISAGKSEEA